MADKDPTAQIEKLTVEEIDLESKLGIDPDPDGQRAHAAFAKVIHNILEPEECEELLSTVNEKGNSTFYE